MALSDREKKRRSRARKPKTYHDREREENRKRMAIVRAKKKAQKRASQLKTLLNEEEKQEIEARAAELKQRLICDWFRHNKLRFNPKLVHDVNILNSFMTKLDLHKIEHQVAEFEASLMGGRLVVDGDNKDIALGLGGDGGKLSSKMDLREQHVGVTNNEIDGLLEKDAATSDIIGKYHQNILGADRQESTEQTFSGMASMKLVERWEDEILAAEAMSIMKLR